MSEPAAAPARVPVEAAGAPDTRRTPLRALVLAGGLTFEREVSINSVARWSRH